MYCNTILLLFLVWTHSFFWWYGGMVWWVVVWYGVWYGMVVWYGGGTIPYHMVPYQPHKIYVRGMQPDVTEWSGILAKLYLF